MINHGLITGALFLLVGVIYERTHDRTIAKMGGLAAKMPVYVAVFGFFVFASAGLPGLSGFVGEFLTLVGTFQASPAAAAVATFVMILAAGYLLYMFGRVVFGEVSGFLEGLGHHLTDMTATEVLTLVPLGALVVAFGIQPGLLLDLFPRHGRPDARVGRAGHADRHRPRDRHRPASRCWSSAIIARIGYVLDRRPAERRRARRHRAAGRRGRRGRALTTDDLLVISPLLVAILTAVAIMVVDLIKPGSMLLAAATAFIGLALTSVVTLVVGAAAADGTIPSTAFGGAYTVNALTTFLDILFVSIIALTIMFAPDYLTPRGLPLAEFATVLVFAMTGAMLISASTDLLLLFLGLELMVLPGYLLAAFHKTDAYSTEGAIKYFLLGSFSSAIFLFGLAFVWGMTGTTLITGPNGITAQLGAIVAGTAPLSPGLAMGLAFLTTGVAFKIAAVPFHYWTPDAYQGSPTPITGYLSVGPKIGAFALIIRLFVEALGPLSEWWLPVIIVLAAITMTLGNLVALTQDNVKRMLAYSSIAHTGYMLVGLAAYAAGQIDGLEGLLFYGAAYAFMNLGAFAVIAALQKRTGVTSSLETFSGLGRREPRLGILMTLFLLSLTGIPPTAGFFAKAYVILAAVEAGGPLTILAVIAVINAAVAAFYYLRCVVYMYMRDPTSEAPAMRHGALVWSGLAVATALTILIGLFPSRWSTSSRRPRRPPIPG